MKLKLLIIAFVLTWSSAQGGDTLTHKKIRSNTFALKGKILPWSAIVIPISGVNYSLGFEYGFGRVNSIGIDLVYNDNVGHKDYSNANGTDSAGPNGFTVGRSVFLNYRRYVHMEHSALYKWISYKAAEDLLPYISVFVRYGKKDYHYDLNFETNNISYDEWQYSAGALVGVVFNHLDINTGLFYKQTYIASTDIENKIRVNSRYMRPSWGFRIGCNFDFVIKRKGNHYLAKYTKEAYKNIW